MAGESTPGCVHIPFYATGFRGDQLAAALAEIAAVAPRYGATHYDVYRSRDDMYRFLLVVEFSSKLDWERYWSGPEFIAMRTRCSSWYQVPLLYAWNDIVATGPAREREVELQPLEVE
jgi:quinol monooxygenase YgiN